jgi:hypothetical protein
MILMAIKNQITINKKEFLKDRAAIELIFQSHPINVKSRAQ